MSSIHDYKEESQESNKDNGGDECVLHMLNAGRRWRENDIM